MEDSTASHVRFGIFELDLNTGELRKSGTLVSLPPQPFKILALLTNHAGQLVPREEIRKQIWGDQTFVDFEKGLNFAIKRIREALGDDAGSPRYIETLPRRGYRFIAPVERVACNTDSFFETHVLPGRPRLQNSSESSTEPMPRARRLETSEAQGSLTSDPIVQMPQPLLENVRASEFQTKRKPTWQITVSLTAALVTIAVTFFLMTLRQPPGRAVLVVLPFDNFTGDANQEYFSDGITEELSTQLARLDPQRLGVIGRITAMTFKHSGKTIQQIGKETHAQLVLEGSVRCDGENLRITAQLIRVENQEHVWVNEYDRTLQGALAMQREVATAIASAIQLKLPLEHEASLAGKKSLDPDAYDAYARGRYQLKKRTKASFNKAIEYFQQALKKDPNYASAYAGLADSHNLLGVYGYSRPDEVYPTAKAEALKALKIDDTLAEAYTTLADVKTNYDWDWHGAEDDFKHAIQLDPNYDTGHLWYGEDYLSRRGRHQEAIAEVKRAQQIDPLSPIIGAIVSEMYYFARQYDQAINEAQKTLDLEPEFVPALERLGWAYEQKTMYREAIQVFEHWQKISRDDPEMKAQLAHAYALSGRRNEALKLLKELEDESRPEHVSPYFVAVVYTALEENDRALDWLEKTCQAREMPPIEVEPRFDNLRSNPRFKELLRRVESADHCER
jgi:TolB-like protein/DNA-binding winged helix-turn-helix (wHTH) protein/Tfp pilus assembly protein PilF